MLPAIGLALLLASPAAARLIYVAPPTAFHPAGGGAVTYFPGSGQSVRLAFGSTAFTTLEDAVAAANANGDTRNTIRMAGGTFDVRVAQVVVARPLTVIGSGPGTTVIRPTVSAPSTTGDGRAFILVARGETLHLAQLTLNGQAPVDIGAIPPFDVPDALRFTEIGTAAPASSLVDHVRLRNVRAGFPPVANYDGFGVVVRAGNVTVSETSFENIGRGGVTWFDGDATDTAGVAGALLGSTYLGKGPGTTLDHGAQVMGGATVTVRGNVFKNALGERPSDGSDSAGVLVFSDPLFERAPPLALVESNLFTSDREGIQVGEGVAATNDISNVMISANNLAGPFGDTFAIFSLRFSTFPAPYNWWGSAAGPFNAFNNPTGNPAVQVTSQVTPLQPFATHGFPLTFTPPPAGIFSVAGTIHGHVTQEGSGAPQPGRTLFLDTNGNGVLNDGETSSITDATGAYRFNKLVVEQRGTKYPVRLVSRGTKTATLTPAALTATIDWVVPAP